MPEKFTTMQVYETDQEVLLDRYGKPAREALKKALSDNCPHPEEKRTYVVANLPAVGQEVMTTDTRRRAVGGFYCDECGQYVFKKQSESVAS